MKKTFSTTFTITEGRIKYDSLLDFDKFKQFHEGKTGELTYKIVDTSKPLYWMHKLYRGVYLIYIARESFSDDVFKAHLELKKMFLMVKCTEYSEIPDKFKNDKTMFIFDKDNLAGYIPSLGDIHIDKMRDYLFKLEGLIVDLQISLTADEAEIRRRAYEKNA